VEERIYWHTARICPNGDLLANYVAVAGSPYGYGLAKMDKESKLIWQIPDNLHHDFDLDDEGRVYAFRHSFEKEPHEAAPHLRTPRINDYVAVFSPEGKEIKRISLLDAFAKSNFRQYLNSIPSHKKGDHTHGNGIDVITEAFAKNHGICKAGDVMISMRSPSMLAIINLDREEVIWAAHGIWKLQHDCDPLENGNILLFDNVGKCGAGGRSRILEWNPISGAIAWSYSGTSEAPFESDSRGCQQLLPNGNILVTEANKGRIFEVTRDQQIAWEYCNPLRKPDHKDYVAVVCSAERHDASKLTFLNSGDFNESRARVSTAAAEKKNNVLR
jgi:hypothetical protein